MKLGAFEIPDVRLTPTIVETLAEIYKVKKREKIQSKDLAIFLGFKYGTEPHYYRKIRSLTGYGLIDGKGIFQVSELGEKLLHPRDDDEKKLVLTKSVFNVPLWKDIYQKHGKKPREDNFWAVLMDITKTDPDTAKSNATKVLGWYMADIAHVSDSFALQDEATTPTIEPLRSSTMKNKQGSKSDVQTIFFDEYEVTLPKGDLTKEWEKLKKYMEIKLEDYKYEEPQAENTTDESNPESED